MRNILSELTRMKDAILHATKTIFCGTSLLEKQDRLYLEEITADTNISRQVPFLLLLALFQISNLLVDYFSKAHPGYTFYYLSAGVYQLTLSLVYLLIVSFLLAKPGASLRNKQMVYRSFWLLFSLGVLYLSTLDILERDSLLNVFVLMSSLAIVPIFNFREISLFAGLNLLYLMVLLFFLKEKVFLIQQAVMAGVSAITLSQMLYASFFSSKVLQKRLKDANTELEKLSETDRLTGLLNRLGLENQMPALLEKTDRLSLIIFDIDHFKEYNDKFGHLQGDRCLQMVAENLKKVFEKDGHLLCRFGGEEFAIFLTGPTALEPLILARELKRAVECEKFPAGCVKVSDFVTVSAGVVSIHISELDGIEALITDADRELYHAKENGRNCISYGKKLYC